MELPSQRGSKADRSGKDWYSVSVETLQSWGLLMFIVVLAVVGFVVYQMWVQQSAEGEARVVIGQAEALRQRLAGDKRVEPGFTGRFALARTSLDEARTKVAARSFRGALAAGRHSRDTFQSILDELSQRGGAG